MITAEKYYGVKCRIFTKNIKQLEDVRAQIEDVIEKTVKQMRFEEGVEVILLARDHCKYCGEPWGKCQCGRPHQRPLV